MNILYLIDQLLCRGGTERHLYDLASGMANLGHKVLVVCLQEGPFAAEFKANKSLDYRCLNVERIYDARGVSGLYRLKCWLEEGEIDVLQTFHSGADLIGPVAAVWSRARPVVISSRRDLGYTKSARQLILQRYLNKYVDRILGNSEAVKQVVVDQEKVAPGKVDVIYNGIDIQRLVPDQAKVEAWKNEFALDGCIVVGSVGNIRPVKGYDDLVKAAALLVSQCPAVRFVLAGDGVTKEMRSQVERLGMENRFLFVGAVPEIDIPSFLQLLDIYVQPSHSEGFSNAVLEAMAVGLPVIVTDVGGNKEVITHDVEGLKVSPKAPPELAEAIMRLAEDPASGEKFGRSAKTRVEKDFMYEGMLKKYHDLYHGLLLNTR